VELHKDELANIEAVINLDAIGFGGHLRIVTEGSWLDYGPLKTSEWLNEAIRQAADDLNYHIATTPCPLGAADATPFLANDVPAAWLWRFDDPYWHTPLDDPMRVDPNSLKYTA
jgi:Zn-dependent M28 family amino/carboxypeptidase